MSSGRPTAAALAAPEQGPADAGAGPSTAELVRERGAALLDGLEEHDPGARAHATATATYAFLTALELGTGRARATVIREAARLHAVGKLYLPKSLLGRPREELDLADRYRASSHEEAGAAVIAGAGIDAPVPTWVRLAGERFDGSGPGRVPAAQIPLESRIIRAACVSARALAEQADQGSGPNVARVLAERSGSELDPGVVVALRRILKRTAT